MDTGLAIRQLGLDQTWRVLEEHSVEEYPDAFNSVPEDFRKKLEEGNVTDEDIIDFFSQQIEIPTELKPALLEFLLLKKAWLLIRSDRGAEALQTIDRIPAAEDESRNAWICKAVAQLNLERYDEALQSFGRAYLLKGHLGSEAAKHMVALFKGWSGCALLLSLKGIVEEDLPQAEKGVREYLGVLDTAQAEGLPNAVMTPLINGSIKTVLPEMRAAFEELELMVRLLSIKDPFDRWRELTKEISKVWPEGVSAVDAIREQRE